METIENNPSKDMKCKLYSGVKTKKFIKNATKIHGDLYDYSIVKFINGRTNVDIMCRTHGKFEQNPYNHLKGYGCSLCSGKKYKTTEEFIENARKIHGDLYDYSQVNYKTNKIKVIIICKIHDKFEQAPSDHLKGNKCSSCRHITTEQFIDDARKVHGDLYDYSLVDYINNKTNVVIICKIHEEFEQVPDGHLHGYKCPMCSKNKYSRKAIKWLKEMEIQNGVNIQHAENGGEIRIDLKYWNMKSDLYKSHFMLDGFDQKKSSML